MTNEFDDDPLLGDLNRKFACVKLVEEVVTDYDCEDLFEFSEHIRGDNVFYGIIGIRRYLTQDISMKRIQHILDLDILPIICDQLTNQSHLQMQYEAAWILTNLAFGTEEQTRALIEAGVIQSLTSAFFNTFEFRIKAQTAWAIANIAIDEPGYREELADMNFIGELSQVLLAKLLTTNPCHVTQNQQNDIDPVVYILEGKDLEDVKDLTWSLASMCRGGFRTMEHWQQYISAYDALTQAIFFENKSIWIEACWGISRILSNMYRNIHFFNQLKFTPCLCQRLVSMLKTKGDNNVLCVIQAICNYSTGPSHILDALIESSLLNSLWWYCTPDIPVQLRRNSILTISNLAAASQNVVEAIIANENIMASLVYHLTIPGHKFHPPHYWIEDKNVVIPLGEWKVLKEVLYVFLNIFLVGSDNCMITTLNEYTGILPCLVHLLFYPLLSSQMTTQILDIITPLVLRTCRMTTGTNNRHNPYLSEMLGEGIVEAINCHIHVDMDMTLSDKIEVLKDVIKRSQEVCFNDIRVEMKEDDEIMITHYPENEEHDPLFTRVMQRRIVQGREDGDVRLIENAINSLTL